MNQNCQQRYMVQLYKDIQKLLNEFEIRFQSTQRGLTLGTCTANREIFVF